MAKSEYVDPVYAFIWRCITEQETLPTQAQIANELGLSQPIVSGCVSVLRQQGRLSKTTLLPTAYAAWWREQVRCEQRWGIKPLVPLKRREVQQLPLL